VSGASADGGGGRGLRARSETKLASLVLQLGVKTDPVQYRFSYPWLFQLLAELGVRRVQLGTFFELYQLPDVFFERLRAEAEAHGVQIASVFTAHRELGGFFIEEEGFEAAARRSYERLIDVDALVEARSVGSNPGAVYRDRMETKPRALARYLRHMKELMAYAYQRGVEWLTIEPMSCLAEPPALPEEIRAMAEELEAHHRQHPRATARVGYCVDIAHAYVDRHLRVRHDHLELLRAALPHLYELHLKNTDARYCSTFGFAPEERAGGVIQIEPVRRMLMEQADVVPVDRVTGYLEIGGPKLGRDYSDKDLAAQLRASLEYLKRAWADGGPEADTVEGGDGRGCPIKVAPSVMCGELGRLEQSVRRLEEAGADMLHVDMADGHFVPNLLLGLDTVCVLRRITTLPLDVHLMVDNPDQYIEPLARCGADQVAVHAEVCVHLDRTLAEIRKRGMRAGVALNPATPLAVLEYVRPRLDFVLLMTVNPGFAGQPLAAGAIRKIADCRRLLGQDDAAGVPIAVDGNVSFQNIPRMVAAGADVLVAGTSSWFYPHDDLGANVAKTNRAIREGWAGRSR